MEIKTYNDMTVEVLDRTPIPQELIQFACDICMKKADDITEKQVSSALAKSLLTAEHTSVLEHSSMSLLIKGVSRSFLAQITRHRVFSFTSASQHYQEYSEYPLIISPEFHPKNNGVVGDIFEYALETSLEFYQKLLDNNIPPEEARQVLPNACSVNLILTGNIRAYVGMLRTRLCERNVSEMLVFANKVLKVCKSWCPEVFEHVGAPCDIDGKCNQGRLSCGKK